MSEFWSFDEVGSDMIKFMFQSSFHFVPEGLN